jgi:2Fe-2S ferredoxin
MVAIHVTNRAGQKHTIKGKPNQTLMEVLRDHNMDVEAICGGVCSCATCHVYIEPEWFAKTGKRTAQEESMLSFAAVTKENSRLSCQITMTEELDGLVLRMPEGQH